MTENTFDINTFSKERQAEPASYGQCKALGFHFAKQTNGNMDWRLAKQVTAMLYGKSKEGKFTFKQASAQFNKKTMPKVFKEAIDEYLSKNS